MTIFLESPWPAAMLCIVVQIILGIVFLRTGRALVLLAMALVLAVTAGLILLEQAIVTETEEVEDTLHGIAELLESNDAAAVLAAFAPSCPQLPRVRSALADVTVHSASVGGDLEVRINQLTSPPSATTYFTGRINAREKRGTTIPYENFIRKFKVRFERHGDRWLIVEVQEAEAGGSNR